MKLIFYGGMSTSSRGDEEQKQVEKLFGCPAEYFNSAYMIQYDQALAYFAECLKQDDPILLVGKSLGSVCAMELVKSFHLSVKTHGRVALYTFDPHTNFMIKFSRGYPIYNERRAITEKLSVYWENYFQRGDGLQGAVSTFANLNKELTGNVFYDGEWEPVSHTNILFHNEISPKINIDKPSDLV